MSNRDQESQGFSRRNFIKGGLVAGATGLGLSFSDKMVLASQLISGRPATIETIQGVGVPPGLVRMNLNENPLGTSPKAIEAIAHKMFSVNRYGMEMNDLLQALSEFDQVVLPKPDPGAQRSFFRTPS